MSRGWLITGASALLVFGITVWLATSPEDRAPEARVEAPARATAETPRPAGPAPDPLPAQPPARAASTTTSCATNEEFLSYRRDQARQSVPALYADVGAQVGFTPEESTRFIALVVEQHAERAMPLETLCGDAETARRARDEMTRRHEREIATFVGARRMPAFEQFQQSHAAKLELSAMADVLRRSHLPLSENQRQALRESVLRPGAVLEPPGYEGGGSAWAFRQELATWIDQNDQLLLSSARQTLDAKQLEQYARFLEQRHELVMDEQLRKAGVELRAADPQQE